MLRMEIALILVLGFVAYIYYSAERTQTALHRTFSALLAAVAVLLGRENRILIAAALLCRKFRILHAKHARPFSPCFKKFLAFSHK